MERSKPFQRSVAVIGSGVSGLVAAYVLAQRDHVTFYEADARLGGHAHTHRIPLDQDGQTVAVDSAFLVHNDRTYPTLCRLFGELGIATRETDMSMSVRDDATGLEYAGARGIGGLFPSWSSFTRPRYLLMLAEVKRFHRAALRLLAGDADEETVGDFLTRHRFSQYFIDYFMTPLIAAVWSSPPGQSLNYPARYLFVFLEHHGMLSVFDSPTWRTVVGGSATYVDAVANVIDEVRIGTPVRSVRRVTDGVEVSDGISGPRRFDAVVVATHPDQALLMLSEPTSAERNVLGAIEYSTNYAQLHTDQSVLPRHQLARASWNYLATADDQQVLVTYDVTRLMRLDGDRRFLVTLGGADRVDPASVLTEMTYSHPMYTPKSVAAQQLLPSLNDDRVVFAGAYHGWGFHEDGAASGLRAAQHLGAEWPAATREVVPC
ncbi:putative NAD/FAD-binding protein [Mycolicibacterium rhodesiae NBB3]|uniref:Putative NAD/FAD-binding protein n=1 Tax=Mycolicibacterium rhodesiae (strain NBB3) TaxID=710685 RepID=G8RNU0_MYCRN|nr:FAD-dependent oxidoreductase [Mycolicibacterium rhodesiae]AEV73791.1 putative NAD/FAD-binding protein [Mycolicibacterium rhodesiae NBB3]